jgi:uncharacterized protein YuzE
MRTVGHRSTYDDQADALYLYLQDEAEVARSVVVDDARVVDLDAEGRAVGIEVLGASAGVHLVDLAGRSGLRNQYQALRRVVKRDGFTGGSDL